MASTPRTPAVEGMDQWFDSFQQFEATLEGMASASMDVKFKEELTAIEQWFKVLSESERAASLYSLLQHATPAQIKFFIAVLQQMAKSDPMTPATAMTALSPMQHSAVKSKLSVLSPLARSFNPGNVSAPANTHKNRQFLPLDSPIDAPSPVGATNSAATLALQRARLRAMQSSSHRPVPASAPILEEGRNAWGPGSHPLAKKISEDSIEEEAPSSADTVDSPALATPSTSDQTAVDPESWSSMVNTPLDKMFPNDRLQLVTEHTMLQPWSAEGVVPQIGDAAIYRKSVKGNKKKGGQPHAHGKQGAFIRYPIDALSMPSPVDIIPNAYNLNTMSALGMSPEDQLRAVQMFVSGYAPPQHGRHGAPPKSANSASGKSAGLKSASNGGSVINRENETDPELLKDIPAWLKALRLHKYVPSFEGLSWKEMVVLEESELETRGVATVGARKRFLRLFETVRKSQGMESSAAVVAEKVDAVEPLPLAPSVPVAVC